MHPDDRAPLRAVLARLVGDEVIVEFARRLGACVRAEDPVARLGGDEFVVLVEDLEGAVTAEAIAAKLLVAMHDDVATSDGPIRMTTSVGVAVSHGRIDPIALVALADQTLYAATSAGRNTYRVRNAKESAGAEERQVAPSAANCNIAALARAAPHDATSDGSASPPKIGRKCPSSPLADTYAHS